MATTVHGAGKLMMRFQHLHAIQSLRDDEAEYACIQTGVTLQVTAPVHNAKAE